MRSSEITNKEESEPWEAASAQRGSQIGRKVLERRMIVVHRAQVKLGEAMIVRESQLELLEVPPCREQAAGHVARGTANGESERHKRGMAMQRSTFERCAFHYFSSRAAPPHERWPMRRTRRPARTLAQP